MACASGGATRLATQVSKWMKLARRVAAREVAAQVDIKVLALLVRRELSSQIAALVCLPAFQSVANVVGFNTSP